MGARSFRQNLDALWPGREQIGEAQLRRDVNHLCGRVVRNEVQPRQWCCGKRVSHGMFLSIVQAGKSVTLSRWISWGSNEGLCVPGEPGRGPCVHVRRVAVALLEWEVTCREST